MLKVLRRSKDRNIMWSELVTHFQVAAEIFQRVVGAARVGGLCGTVGHITIVFVRTRNIELVCFFGDVQNQRGHVKLLVLQGIGQRVLGFRFDLLLGKSRHGVRHFDIY
jgi:hypothetical protein